MLYMPDLLTVDLRRVTALCVIFGFMTGGLAQTGYAQDSSKHSLSLPPSQMASSVLSSETEVLPDGSFDENFAGWTTLSAAEMSQHNGGTGINLGDVGVNLATNNAALLGNSVDGTVTTGQIKDLNLNDVGGINSLMFNTGNNVNFQSNMLINIFVK